MICPVISLINLESIKEQIKQIKLSGILSIVIGAVSSVIEPLLGELVNMGASIIDAGLSIINTITDLLGSLSSTSWALYIAQYQANLVRDAATREIGLLGELKNELSKLNKDSNPQSDMYKKLNKLCNRVRPKIRKALEDTLDMYSASDIVDRINTARRYSDSLRKVLALRDLGIGADILGILQNAVKTGVQIETEGGAWHDVILDEKTRTDLIKDPLYNLNISELIDDLPRSMIDEAGNNLLDTVMDTLQQYVEIVKLCTGHSLQRYVDQMAEDLAKMGGDIAGMNYDDLKKLQGKDIGKGIGMGDYTKLIADVMKSSLLPYYTFDNDPNMGEWTYKINGEISDLTIFGANMKVIEGITLLHILDGIIGTNINSKDRIIDRSMLLYDLKLKIVEIRNKIPLSLSSPSGIQDCGIKNLLTRLAAWSKVNGIHIDLEMAYALMAKDALQQEEQAEWAKLLKESIIMLRAVDEAYIEDAQITDPSFTSRMTLEILLKLVATTFTGKFNTTEYDDIIDKRIAYLREILVAIDDLRGYSDPYVEGLLEMFNELGLNALFGNIMSGEILLNNLPIDQAMIANGAAIAALVDACITPIMRNPEIAKKDKKKMIKTVNTFVKKAEESLDKVTQGIMDAAMSVLGFGADALNKLIQMHNKSIIDKQELNKAVKMAADMATFV